MLVEEDDSAKDAEVVIRAVEGYQADHKAADELEAALGIKSQELAAELLGFWRNLRALVGARGTRTTFRISTRHSADDLESTTHSTPVRISRATPHLVSGQPDYGPFL